MPADPRPWHSCRMAKVRVTIVFGPGARVGHGKAKLLEAIRDTGSISAAARDMGMSYKRALAVARQHQPGFHQTCGFGSAGQSGGGGARLTSFGMDVLERYTKIADRSATLAIDDIAVLAEHACPEADPKI